MKSIWLIGAIAIVSQTLGVAQNSDITVKPYGYVSYEMIYDSYKSVDSRDGELYLYPVRRSLDVEGKDINAKSQLQMLALQARFGFLVSGPQIGKAKSSAQIEGDFYGTADSYVNMVRLRLAFIKLSWEKTDLILGQNFHPTIISECSPSTLSFGGGVPYHTLNRSVQARLNYKVTPGFKLSIATLMASTHRSVGPIDAQRKSGLPEAQFQAQIGSAEKLLAGITAGYKFLSILDTTQLGYKTDGRVGSYNLQAFARFTSAKFVVKTQVNYGTNLTNFSFIGGYGVKANSADPVTGEIAFTNIKTLTSWLDMETKFPKLNFGLYAGYGQNLGAEGEIDTSTPYTSKLFYTKNGDISYIFRIAPRFFLKNNNLLYGIEWGLNGAAYATEYNLKRKATKTDDLVYNNRILLLVKYNF